MSGFGWIALIAVVVLVVFCGVKLCQKQRKNNQTLGHKQKTIRPDRGSVFPTRGSRH